MSNSINGGGGRRLEGTLIVAGMVTVQALVAVYTVFIAGLLAVGVEPLFLVAASGFVNSLFLFPLAAIFEKKKWPSKLGVNLMAGLITCIAVSGVAWCMQTKGPVFVSVFQPMQTICAAILSAVFLRQPISLASFAGIGLMFAGLYIVLWAKNKEAINNLAIRKETIRPDNEKPLLC
ncbi:WAT1-related protein [Apostasia shenzhenica]|uniref:WAT1-related protein n=1 Tax=Apostasia shenzhenica TaxID=1088818 RepID=A0A2I0BEQ6_9ASPA|nr:WAT1-related protein [Apostasia shenzhenica]